LHQPVPRPTKAAIAQNKAEEDSRREAGTISKIMRSFEKHPSVAQATKVGEPTLVDPTPVSASQVVQQATRAALGAGGESNNSVSIETVGGAPGPSQPAPRSDTPAPADAAASADSSAAADTSAPPAASNDLTPSTGPADPNELKPNVTEDNGQALPPPQQVNEIQGGAASAPANSASSAASTGDTKSGDTSASSSAQANDDTDATVASSKPKKKKGIHKIIPF